MLKRNNMDDDHKIPHIVRRATLSPEIYHSDALPLSTTRLDTKQFEKVRASHRPAGNILTAEIALFFDEAGYNIFAPYLDYDDKKLHDMLLAYVNGVTNKKLACVQIHFPIAILGASVVSPSDCRDIAGIKLGTHGHYEEAAFKNAPLRRRTFKTTRFLLCLPKKLES